MFDLNDIWRAFGLQDKQAPNQWRNKVKEHLFETANLQVQRNGRGGQFTWATLEALYAYAMWVDVEFYMVVVEAFAALTRGETEKAQESIVSVSQRSSESISPANLSKCINKTIAISESLTDVLRVSYCLTEKNNEYRYLSRHRRTVRSDTATTS